MSILLFIVAMFWIISSPGSFIFIVIIGLITFVLILYNDSYKEKSKKEGKLRNQEKENLRIKNLVEQYNIPNDSKIINCKNGNNLIDKNNFEAFIWVDNMKIFMVDNSIIDGFGKISIPLNEIIYYEFDGDIHRETNISGGGISGGGSSLGGAVVGGMIAGDAGAIIGSRKEIKSIPINSKTITHDERETYLNYYSDGVKKTITFDYEGYKILLSLIPEKSYKNIHANYIIDKSKKKNIKDNSQRITSQIKELAELRDESILSEHEFQEKKRELLERL